MQRAGEHVPEHAHKALCGGVPACARYGEQLLPPVGVHVRRGLQVDFATLALGFKPKLSVEFIHHSLDHAQHLLGQKLQAQRIMPVQVEVAGKILRRIPGRRHASGIAVEHKHIRLHQCNLPFHVRPVSVPSSTTAVSAGLTISSSFVIPSPLLGLMNE